MIDLLGLAVYAAMLIFPAWAFHRAVHRPAVTHAQVVAATTSAGGFAGALGALLIAAGGATFTDAAPFAALGVGAGLVIAGLGFAARAFGRWLTRAP